MIFVSEAHKQGYIAGNNRLCEKWENPYIPVYDEQNFRADLSDEHYEWKSGYESAERGEK